MTGPGGPAQKFREKAAAFSRDLCTKAATQMFMAFSLPTRDLKLGEDIVPPDRRTQIPQPVDQARAAASHRIGANV